MQSDKKLNMTNTGTGDDKWSSEYFNGWSLNHVIKTRRKFLPENLNFK